MKYISRITIPPALFLALCFSCSGFDSLEVIRISPVNHARGVGETAEVEIVFNNDADKESLERIFVLSGGSSRVEGSFEWPSGKHFIFRPQKGLSHGKRYTIEIPRTLRDTKGNGMEFDFLSEFYVGEDFIAPLVLASNPALVEGGERNVPVDRNITIDFSKTMDVQKTESSFSITPHVAGRFVWETGPGGLPNGRMQYLLTAAMDYGVHYRFRIGPSAVDASGNQLTSEYTVHFVTGEDADPPAVMGINSDGLPPFWSTEAIAGDIDKNISFYIAFSAPMDRPSAESAFSITPSPGGHFSWDGDSILVFHPSRDLSPETVYRLRVDRAARDRNGRRLTAPHQLMIRTDALASLSLKIGTVSGSHDGSSYTALFMGPPSPDAWPIAINMGPWPNQAYYFRVQFVSLLSPYSPAGMDKYSIYQNLSLASYGDYEGIVSDVQWEDDTTVLIRLSGLSNKREPASPVLYRLTIHGGSGGVKDEYGNTMRENFVIDFRED